MLLSAYPVFPENRNSLVESRQVNWNDNDRTRDQTLSCSNGWEQQQAQELVHRPQFSGTRRMHNSARRSDTRISSGSMRAPVSC